MSKFTAKCKLCRREGEKLYLRGERCASPKCALVKRNYPPGVHGPKSAKHKLSGYGKEMRERQKCKRIYGLGERQFANYVQKALKAKGNSGENLIQLLESRLDNVIYRLGLAKSRRAARQLINHGHFSVNNRLTTAPACQMRPGDLIKIHPSSLNKAPFKELEDKLKNYNLPNWLTFDFKNNEAKILEKPSGEAVKQNFDPKLIIEFYSR